MKDHFDDVVRRAVARHLGVDHAAIDALQHLHRDLHLQPLDIVLIVLAIEDAERIELPIAHLESHVTVGGLTMLVRRVCAGLHHAYRPAFVPIYRRQRRSRRSLRRALEV
jgi:acyl carrier protein